MAKNPQKSQKSTKLSGDTVFKHPSVFSKTRQNGPFLAFLMNFWPLKMVNETFSGIFKHSEVKEP